mgnify:CR=1 FL=1
MIDQEKIKQAVKLLLEGIGEDTGREGLKETPERIARMYEEIYGGMDEDAAEHLKKTFHVENNEIVMEKDITFYSTCEHHLLPFYGKAHIAYIPDGKVVGLSKLARTVEAFARRLQIQEQLTGQIADALMEHLKPKGVLVMIEAEHMCMTMRGIKKPGSQTVTVVKRGVFLEDPELTNLFFQMICAEYLAQCDIDAHIDSIKKLYFERMTVMADAMEEGFANRARFHRPDGGLFIWCSLPEGYDGMEFCRRTGQVKVAAVPGASFSVNEKEVVPTFRLNFSLSDNETIRRGIALMAQAMAEYVK